MTTITSAELDFESVEMLPERAALGYGGYDHYWCPYINATNIAVATNGYGYHNVTQAEATQWIHA